MRRMSAVTRRGTHCRPRTVEPDVSAQSSAEATPHDGGRRSALATQCHKHVRALRRSRQAAMWGDNGSRVAGTVRRSEHAGAERLLALAPDPIGSRVRLAREDLD